MMVGEGLCPALGVLYHRTIIIIITGSPTSGGVWQQLAGSIVEVCAPVGDFVTCSHSAGVVGYEILVTYCMIAGYLVLGM